MDLRELDHDEAVALVALVEIVLTSDREVSDDELAKLDEIVAAVGEERYRAIALDVDERFPDEESLREFLSTIRRQAARELIYATVMDAALLDAITTVEAQFLEWLAKEWCVSVRVIEPAR